MCARFSGLSTEEPPQLIDRFKVCLSKQALSVWRVRVLSDCYFRIHSTSRRSRRLQLQVESSTFARGALGRRARSVTNGCDTDFKVLLRPGPSSGSHIMMVGSMSAARKIRGESRESAACMPYVEGSNQLCRPGPGARCCLLKRHPIVAIMMV